jgi:dienelactone hydrolase
MVRCALVLVMLMAGMAQAAMKTRAAEYEYGGKTFEGYLAYDDAIKERRPGVLVVHEWTGLNDYAKSRANQLAEMGYVAFAVDMYGKGVRPAPGEEAKMSGELKANPAELRGRIRSAHDAMRKWPQVDVARTAVIGYCFGGTTALELARSGANIAGAVSFHGALVTPAPAKEGEVRAKVLVCHGADDPFVPMKDVVGFVEEMRGAKANYQVNMYADAVHTFTNPAAKGSTMKGVAYNEQADRRSWEDMKRFFDEIFKN